MVQLLLMPWIPFHQEGCKDAALTHNTFLAIETGIEHIITTINNLQWKLNTLGTLLIWGSSEPWNPKKMNINAKRSIQEARVTIYTLQGCVPRAKGLAWRIMLDWYGHPFVLVNKRGEAARSFRPRVGVIGEHDAIPDRTARMEISGRKTDSRE